MCVGGGGLGGWFQNVNVIKCYQQQKLSFHQEKNSTYSSKKKDTIKNEKNTFKLDLPLDLCINEFYRNKLDKYSTNFGMKTYIILINIQRTE